jgi:hypothetical protein
MKELRLCFKKLRKSFIAFINFYNKRRLDMRELNISYPSEVKKSVKILYTAWDEYSEIYMFNIDFMFNMKKYHTIITGHFLQENTWKTYITNSIEYRLNLIDYLINIGGLNEIYYELYINTIDTNGITREEIEQIIKSNLMIDDLFICKNKDT